jgi:tetratricopeptide (TPR) repeat protein
MQIVQAVKTAVETKPATSALIIAIVAILFYLPILWADFVYDDLGQIVTIDYIHKPSNIVDVITLSVMRTNVLDNNRPMMLLSLMADSLLWGRNPFGYHLTNLLLHTASSVMLFLFVYGVLSRLFASSNKSIGDLRAAFVAALVFAIHPVNSEAVCVPTFREDLLVVFFTLLTLILAERFPFARKTANILYCFSTALVIFAASAAKETGIVCPLVLLFYWLIVRRASQWRIWAVPLVVGFICAASFAYLRFTTVPEYKGTFENLGDFYSRITQFQPLIWAYQLLEIFWPLLLSADYNFYSLRHITLPVAYAIIISAIMVVLLLSRKNRGFFLGILFYILAIAPTSNLMAMFKPMADRYLYFPMVGFCLALGSIICILKKPQGRRLLVFRIAAIAIFIYLGMFLVQRVFVWQNSRCLWGDVVKKNPYSVTAFNSFGNALYDDGQYKDALFYYRKAIKIGIEVEHSYPEPYAGLAITYDALGRHAEADEFFLKAVAIDRNYADFEKIVSVPLMTRKHAEKLKVIADRVAARQMVENGKNR